jgi:hypothetical protein
VDLPVLEQKIWDQWLDCLPTRREQKAAARLRKSVATRAEGADWASYSKNLLAALLAVTEPVDDMRQEVRTQFSDVELLALSAAEVRDASLTYTS